MRDNAGQCAVCTVAAARVGSMEGSRTSDDPIAYTKIQYNFSEESPVERVASLEIHGLLDGKHTPQSCSTQASCLDALEAEPRHATAANGRNPG